MFKIGEFSKLVRVSPRMLRHYEKCGLLYPAETDRITGYRQYSAGQIPLLTRIVALRDTGFSIDEIGDIMPHFDDAAYMDSILCAKISAIQTAISVETEKLGAVNAMRKALRREQSTMKYEVNLKEIPRIKVLSLREVISDYRAEGMLWEKLGRFMSQNNIACPAVEESGFSIYHDEDYKETDVDVEIAVPVDALGKNEGAFIYKELDAIPLASTLRFSGPYDNYSAAMGELASWIEANGYEMAGLVRGCAIRTPQDQSDPQNYLTELQVPVKKIN